MYFNQFRVKVILREVIEKEEIEKVATRRVLTAIQDTAVVLMENAKDPEDQGFHKKKRIIMGLKIGRK